MTFIIFKNEHKKLFADKVCKKCGKTFVPKNSGRQAYCGSIRDKNTCAYIHNIEYRLQYQEHWNKLRRVNNNTRMGKKQYKIDKKDLSHNDYFPVIGGCAECENCGKQSYDEDDICYSKVFLLAQTAYQKGCDDTKLRLKKHYEAYI